VADPTATVQNAGMTADALGPVPSDGDDATPLTDAQRALRASMLATEHWSLLASRSTTQSEVLTRIAIFLTLVSVGLFALGVMGNATQFQGWFGVAALGVLLLLVLLGLITAMRVFNTATEDLAYVLAMNRLRGAYLDLDPGMERYLLMSPADDDMGISRTYYPFASRDVSQVLGSSMMIILVVESSLIGLFVASLIVALSGSIGWAVGIGIVLAVASGSAWMQWGYRSYRHVMRTHTPLRTTPAPGSATKRAAPAATAASESAVPVSPEPDTATPAPAAPAPEIPTISTPAAAASELPESDASENPPLRRSRRRAD